MGRNDKAIDPSAMAHMPVENAIRLLMILS